MLRAAYANLCGQRLFFVFFSGRIYRGIQSKAFRLVDLAFFVAECGIKALIFFVDSAKILFAMGAWLSW